MARNIAAEPLLPVADIQGDILGDLVKKFERLIFFTIDGNVAAFRTFVRALEITSSEETLAQRALIAERKAAGNNTLVPTPGLNVSFTFQGLTKLGHLNAKTAGVAALQAGMGKRAALKDPPAAGWKILGPAQRPDGVFILTGASEAEIANTVALHLAPMAGTPPQGAGFTVIHDERGRVRPDPVSGHEHFGYADGISQPGIRGRIADGVPLMETTSDDPNQAAPGQDLLWPGEFVFGYPRQNGTAQTFDLQGPIATPPVGFMANGAFLVFRRLAQRVPEFDLEVKRTAAMTQGADAPTAAQLGAQMVGRWKSGAAIVRAPLADDPSIDESNPSQVNDFEFRAADPDGLVCPFAAHVRKVYPRDDRTPGTNTTEAAEAAVQTHRMLRRGIAFGPELTDAEAESGTSLTGPGQERGLLFKCYVTSIDDQFEFVQQNWVDNAGFLDANSGIDAIIGQPPSPGSLFTGAAPVTRLVANKPAPSFQRFVQMQGGEYFFSPSISAIRSL